MKIMVKQEADTTCAWIVGEDGETYPDASDPGGGAEGTAYLKDGQQVEIEVEIAAVGTEDGQTNYPKATMGEVIEIPATGVTASGPVGGTTLPGGGDPSPKDIVRDDGELGGANDTSALR